MTPKVNFVIHNHELSAQQFISSANWPNIAMVPHCMCYPHSWHSSISPKQFFLCIIQLSIAGSGGDGMLDAEFKRQRAQTVRELAQITTDPFIKQRLIKLAERYEEGDVAARTPLTPVDLKLQNQGIRSER